MSSKKWTLCDIEALARGRRWFRRGWFGIVALLYIECLVLLIALTEGALVAPLAGALVLAAQLPPVLKGARILLRPGQIYRLTGLSPVFMGLMFIDGHLNLPAQLAAVVVLVVPVGLALLAVLRTKPIAATFRRLHDTRALEFCLFGDRPKRPWPQSIRTPRLRAAAPWFTAAGILAGAGIVLSIVIERGVAAIFVILALFLIHRGRRHMAPRATEARQLDERPPVLILRVFQDDLIKMERFSFSPRRSFEQAVAAAFRGAGPPIVVGAPNERLPPLGALREYLADEDWRTAVTRLMDESAMLVFILGDTDNLLWEFSQAMDRDRRVDVLIIAPPLKRQLIESRWQRFSAGVAGSLQPGAPRKLPDRPVLGVFFAGDEPVCITARKREVIDYQLAIRLFLHLSGEDDRIGLRARLEDRLPMIQVTGPGGRSPAPPVTL